MDTERFLIIVVTSVMLMTILGLRADLKSEFIPKKWILKVAAISLFSGLLAGLWAYLLLSESFNIWSVLATAGAGIYAYRFIKYKRFTSLWDMMATGLFWAAAYGLYPSVTCGVVVMVLADLLFLLFPEQKKVKRFKYK